MGTFLSGVLDEEIPKAEVEAAVTNDFAKK